MKNRPRRPLLVPATVAVLALSLAPGMTRAMTSEERDRDMRVVETCRILSQVTFWFAMDGYYEEALREYPHKRAGMRSFRRVIQRQLKEAEQVARTDPGHLLLGPVSARQLQAAHRAGAAALGGSGNDLTPTDEGIVNALANANVQSNSVTERCLWGRGLLPVLDDEPVPAWKLH